MIERSLSVFLLCILIGRVVFAFETDQYNLPPVPLADIGGEVSKYVEDSVLAAVDKVNGDIASQEACLKKDALRPESCGSLADVTRKLAFLRSNDAVALEVYKLQGEGSLFTTKIGKWFKNHKFANTPDRYKIAYSRSIYVFMPLDYSTMSPTVNLFGTELGTDKIEHFFQQGYKYYTIRAGEIAKGRTTSEAESKAVKWGQRTERTYFGLVVSGVYSNADLYANYAGMKFYASLTAAEKIGDTVRRPVLSLEGGRWALNKDNDLRNSLIKPFVTDHLNEALNLSGYAINIYPTVKRVVRNQACPEWRERLPAARKDDLDSRSASLTKWEGQDYGFAAKGWSVPLGSTCFGD